MLRVHCVIIWCPSHRRRKAFIVFPRKMRLVSRHHMTSKRLISFSVWCKYGHIIAPSGNINLPLPLKRSTVGAILLSTAPKKEKVEGNKALCMAGKTWTIWCMCTLPPSPPSMSPARLQVGSLLFGRCCSQVLLRDQ